MIPADVVPYIRYGINRHCPAGPWTIARRTIPDHEFVLITGGRGYVTLQDTEHLAAPGQLFYFYPGLVHAMANCPDNPMSFLAVHFSYARVSYHNSQWSVREGTDPILGMTVLNCQHRARLEQLLFDLIKAWSGQSPAQGHLVRGLFLQILHVLADEERSRQADYASGQRIHAAVQTIQSHFSETLTVSGLASDAGLSADYFASLFRVQTGLSPNAYITRCRIDTAKRLLAEIASEPASRGFPGGSGGSASGSDRHIGDVARAVGYHDAFYFSRVFKKQEGISPSEFLRSVRR